METGGSWMTREIFPFLCDGGVQANIFSKPLRMLGIHSVRKKDKGISEKREVQLKQTMRSEKRKTDKNKNSFLL